MLFDDSRSFLCKGIIIALAVGLAARFAIGTLLSYNYDVFSWALIISNIEAGNGLYDVTGYNYTPVWGYILGIFAQFTEVLGIDVLAERFPELIFTEAAADPIFPHLAFVTTVQFNIAVTTLIAVFDVLTGYVLYRFVCDIYGDAKKAKICAAIWLLCPFVITVGAVGGMFDCISALLTMLCIMLLVKDHEFLAGAVFSTAFLLKFFPVFLFFIFIAYIVAKHRNGDYIGRMVKAALGFGIMALIILAPQIAAGQLGDCFSFITSRVTTSTTVIGDIEHYAAPIAYVLILILEIFIAYRFLKTDHKNLDRSFVWSSFIGILILFIYPSTPTYVLLLTPFLIMTAFVTDRRFRTPMYILMVGTTIFSLSSNAMSLTSITMYTDLLPFDTWMQIYTWFDTRVMGMTVANLMAYIGGTIQYAGILIALYHAFKTLLTVKEECGYNGIHQ